MERTKVLVVEDDPDLRRGLCIRLQAAGYDVASADHAVSAVRIAKREHPDVVLLDVGLPHGGGLAVLEWYGQNPHLCAIPVVVLTGRDPVTTEPAVRRYDIAAFLRKPADNDCLLRAIDRASRGLRDTTDGSTNRAVAS